MKTPHVAILVAAAVGITAGIQEWRMRSLKRTVESAETPAVPERIAPVRNSHGEAAGEPRRRAVAGTEDNNEAANEGQEFTRTIRKMWDNSAGKSIMNQGVRIAIAMMYEDYIETLELTDEEDSYFKDLLGGEMAVQQEYGMKMMGATPEERSEMMAELKRRMESNEEQIKAFLNDDEDFDAYLSYKERLPERQQLDGVRAAMAAKDATMDATTETKLIEAMHKARTQPGLADFSGEGAYEELARSDMTARFEKTWAKQQETLHAEVGFLTKAQKEAFFEHQEQMKEFQLMSLKMAGQMMKSSGD